VADKIVVRQFDSASPTEVTGVVTDVSGDFLDVTVALDGTWTPGSDEWTLESQPHSEATTHQRKYAYVANDDLKLSDDSFAREMA
jgi:hypothetical protein